MSAEAAQNILLIGCGKMGRALLHSWLRHRMVEAEHITVVDHSPSGLPDDVTGLKDLSLLPSSYSPNVVLLAVKPQQMDEVLAVCAQKFSSSCFYITIAAGKTVEYYAKHLGKSTALLRAMPNTPVQAGKGIIGFYAPSSVSPQQKQFADRLFTPLGERLWVEKESMLESVTGLYGSGPAYIFYLLECLTELAVSNGIAEAEAKSLALQLLTGSVELAAQNPQKSYSELRKDVASPGGTTEAALNILMDAQSGMRPLLQHTIDSAMRRSKELS